MLTLLRWVDADTIVMNPYIPLDIFLPPAEFSHLHLLVTADPHGLNNGVFFIKVHRWSVELLSAVAAYRMYRPDTDLPYRDQSALEDVLKEKYFKNNFMLLPQRWFNAIWSEGGDNTTQSFQIQKGDLLVHFPGHPQRDEIMRKYLDRADRHTSEWEIDLESTSYPMEIQAYWAEQLEILERQTAKASNVTRGVKELLGKIDGQMVSHRDKLDSEDAEKIDERIERLNMALNVHRIDEEAVQEESDKLRKVRRKQDHIL